MVPRKPLYGIFTDIPGHYDIINSIITWNLDKGWRHKAAQECLAARPKRVLDLCCGTGDLAITIAKIADYPLEVRGLDYSQPMLNIAEIKAAALKDKTLIFTQGDAARLPFPEAYFDCVGISFAFRNLTYKNPLIPDHLSEILRVLKPGGRCVIVESSQPRSKIVRSLYHFYMRQYVYHIGSLISRNRSAYRYLAESSSSYYSPEELKELLLKTGFSRESYQPLFFGAAGIYVAVK
jgi:demethylmenaquinone methyltransferase / 2-methoxy-6-polyprenyl-1,4-benzoquinol methylase